MLKIKKQEGSNGWNGKEPGKVKSFKKVPRPERVKHVVSRHPRVGGGDVRKQDLLIPTVQSKADE